MIYGSLEKSKENSEKGSKNQNEEENLKQENWHFSGF